MAQFVLASNSASRRAILDAAAIPFDAEGSDVDEAVLKTKWLSEGLSPGEIALGLAEAKALAVSQKRPDDLVLGGDQVLEFKGRLYDKPTSMAEAADRLAAMAGQAHYLRSGLALVRNNHVLWTHRQSAALTMSDITRDDIERYLASVGECLDIALGPRWQHWPICNPSRLFLSSVCWLACLLVISSVKSFNTYFIVMPLLCVCQKRLALTRL